MMTPMVQRAVGEWIRTGEGLTRMDRTILTRIQREQGFEGTLEEYLESIKRGYLASRAVGGQVMERDPCPVCGIRLGVIVPKGSFTYAWRHCKQLGRLAEGALIVINFRRSAATFWRLIKGHATVPKEGS